MLLVKDFLMKHWSWFVMGLLALLLIGSAGYAHNAIQDLWTIEHTSRETFEREKFELDRTIVALNSEHTRLLEKIDSLEKELTTSSTRENKKQVVEKFDPGSGKLIERVTTASKVKQTTRKSVTRKISTQTETNTVKTAQKTEKLIAKKETEHKTAETKHAETKVTYKPLKRGVGVGTLVTTLGAGPAISYQITKLGRVGLDGVVGVANGPMVGAQVSMEALDSVTVGAGMFAGFKGPANAIQWGKVDVVPGATVQYRF